MLIHPNIDPVAVALGPIKVHWYGLMYVFGFLGVYLLGNYRAKKYAEVIPGRWNSEMISDLIFYGALGAVLGGRLGYIFFYKPLTYLQDPLQMFMVNQGGMSFHGGLIGVIVAIMLFARKHNKRWLEIGDFVAPLAPIGLFFGRIGNFINQELWGKPTDLPWGMVFFSDEDKLPRHPSMLYEALLEGLVLLAVLWFLSKKQRPAGFLSGCFLIGYSVARILVEFVRVPDDHLNYLLFGWLTMGHLLSLPMLILGIWMVFRKKDASKTS